MANPYIPLPDAQPAPDYLQSLGQVWAARGQQQLAQQRAMETARAQHNYQNQLKLEDAYRQPPTLLRRDNNQPVTQQDPMQEARDKITRLRGVGTPEASDRADDAEKMLFENQRNQVSLQQQQQQLMKGHVGNAATLAIAAANADPAIAQNAWDAFYRYSKANNLDPDNHLSPVYDPKAAQYYAHLGMTARDQMQQQLELDHAKESARHNQSTEQHQADQLNEMQRYHNQIMNTRRGAPSAAPSAPQLGTSFGDYITNRPSQ